MNYNNLLILIEGDDDKRFFQKLIIAQFKGKYKSPHLIKYSEKSKDYIKKLINSYKQTNSEIILIGDINSEPCITGKKNKIQRNCDNVVDENNIIVVVKEIESWYLAGLNDTACKKLKVVCFPNTDNLTKADFKSLIPKSFDRIDFMIEILKYFSIETAKQKNKSFKYFIKKYEYLLY